MPDEPPSADQSTNIVKAWLRWFVIFVPFFALIMAGAHWFGFSLIFPALIALLCAQLLYQRFINKRTWRSILWGVHASDK